MKRRLTAAALICVALAGGAGWVTLEAGGASRQDDAPDPGHRGAQRCPSMVGNLGPDAIARATDAVLRDAATVFRAKKRRGMRAVSAELASDENRGSYARVTCGRRVFNRTIVVTMRFPAERPSASLSSSTVLVSAIRGRYRVWEIIQ